jgi:hypothetical protein
VEVLICIARVMEPAVSCLPKDTCSRWCPALDDGAASEAVVAQFAAVVMAAAAKVLALRACTVLDGDLL